MLIYSGGPSKEFNLWKPQRERERARRRLVAAKTENECADMMVDFKP